ncbi:SWF/SNF helicase family protein, partial [bacterium]|nr:SWF/SNF helicase family protein [bacterium]
LEDLVRRLRQAEARLLVGTYSGRGGQYTDPATGRLIGTERDEIKQRFLRGQIDILVCTDAAAEGLNLQTADFLVNFDLPWNPAKVEQRIGRIDRIGQLHAHIHVQNLCYLGSVEEIVYGRLLDRLGSMIAVVGDQQVPMLPVTEEDFRRLAAGEVTEGQLEAEARQRIAFSQRRIRETELTGQEVYEIYQRLEQAHAAVRLPATLDGLWGVLTGSAYLKALGCACAVNLTGNGREPLLLRGLAGVLDGTALTTDRRLYEEGIESLGPALRFATYGEPVFDA